MKKLSAKEQFLRDWKSKVDFYNDISWDKFEDSESRCKRQIVRQILANMKVTMIQGIIVIVDQSAPGMELDSLLKNHKGQTLYSCERLQYFLPKFKSYISIQGSDYRRIRNFLHIKKHIRDMVKQKKELLKRLGNNYCPSINGGSVEHLPELLYVTNYGCSVMTSTDISLCFNF